MDIEGSVINLTNIKRKDNSEEAIVSLWYLPESSRETLNSQRQALEFSLPFYLNKEVVKGISLRNAVVEGNSLKRYDSIEFYGSGRYSDPIFKMRREQINPPLREAA